MKNNNTRTGMLLIHAATAGLLLWGSAAWAQQQEAHAPGVQPPGAHPPGVCPHGGGQVAAAPVVGSHAAAAVPALPGQDAFGAIQEVVSILEADPATDWARVSISALREHLVDMNALTLGALVQEREVPGGLEMTVTGEGRVRAAAQRMVPAHASMVQGPQWKAQGHASSKGAVLTVTSSEPRETARIRALGFFGIMVKGSHHQVHHLAMARGKGPHAGHGSHPNH